MIKCVNKFGAYSVLVYFYPQIIRTVTYLKHKHMKAQIENAPEFLNTNTENLSLLIEFNMVLQAITESDDEKRLKIELSSLTSYTHFYWGFGGSHLWVKSTKSDKQIILVEL